MKTIRLTTHKRIIQDEDSTQEWEDFVEVSWQKDHSIEITHEVPVSIIKSCLVGWENFVNRSLHLTNDDSWEDQKNLTDSQSSKRLESYNLLLEQSKTWESILFGGKSWISAEDKSIRFLTDPEWNAIPFEILPFRTSRGGNEFLSKYINIYRSIRTNQDPKRSKKGEKFLLWIPHLDDPILQESIQRERENLENLWDKNGLEYDTLLFRSATGDKFFRSLTNHKYLHFAGHTEQDHLPLPAGQKLHFANLGAMDLSNLEVVFWNSCYSGKQTKVSEGLVGSFLKAGVHNFIGFLGPVHTKKAEFAGLYFWERYLIHGSVAKATQELRDNLVQKFGQEDLTAYLLSMYSGNVLPTVSQKKSLSKLAIIASLGIIALIGSGIFYIFSRDNQLGVEAIEDLPRVEEKIEEKTVLDSKVKTPPKKKEKPVNQKASVESNQIKTDYSKTNLWQDIEDVEFRNQVREFLKNPHPYYSDTEKESIVRSIRARSHETEELQNWKFQQKIGQ